MTASQAPAPWTIPAATRQALPHFELQQISPHGAVFRSNRACEPGTSFAFGIHLPSARRNRLMDLEAIVVDCRAAEGGTALGWEVTLIFDSVTPAQVSALRAASRLYLPHEPFPENGSFFGHGGFYGPGLN
jgi:hypothetical protein